MSLGLPAEIVVTELPEGGVRYRLPRRPSRFMRLIGILPALMGTFVLSWPFVGVLHFWWVGAMEHAPWFAVLGPLACFGPISFPVGGFFLWFGLSVLFGHTEVTVRGGRLAWGERVGWLRWGHSRPLDRVTGFSVEYGSAGAGAKVRPPAQLSDVGKLQVACGGRTAAICGGYPRPWLRALADELARHCPRGAPEAAVPHAVTVSEASLDPLCIEDRPLRPACSPAVLEELDDGVRISIPRLGLRGCHRFLLVWTLGWNGMLLLIVPIVVSTAAAGQVSWRDGPEKAGLAFVCLFLAPFVLVGIGAALVIRHQMVRSAVFDASPDRLTIRLEGVFGTTRHEWGREDLAAVGVESECRQSDEGSSWETRLFVRPRDGEPVRVLGHRPKDELEWVATQLRGALRLPAPSADGSP